jgi:hypothetical protein
MIAHHYCDLITGFGAGSLALPRRMSWFTRVLSTLPIVAWFGPGASVNDSAQHLALQTPAFHLAKKRFWST